MNSRLPAPTAFTMTCVGSPSLQSGKTPRLSTQMTDQASRKRQHGARATWLRALEMTAPIAGQSAAHPCRRHRRTGRQRRAMRRRCSPSARILTYRALAERSNHYARWALAQGLAKGDVVCLLMPNRPEYLAIWLGITRVGGVVSLLNTNLRGASLAHCIDIVAPKHIIVAAELQRGFRRRARASRRASRKSGRTARAIEFARIDREVERHSGDAVERAPSAARSASRIARSTSTPPARPVCRRPPTSAIIG